jgi:HEAT repeats/PBS lyase HEAT-like repeat
MNRVTPKSMIALTTLSAVAISVTGGCGLDLAGGSDLTQESVLSVFSAPDPAQAARWAADPYDPDKRQRGMLLLANAPWGGEPVYLNFYTTALEDEDARVRAVACLAFSLHGAPDNVPAILEKLSDPEVVVRRAAALALQRVHNPLAIDPLLKASSPRSEDDTETRAAAATALGQYPDPQVIQGLIGSLRDRRLLVNKASLDSLIVLTGQDFGYDVGAWLQWTGETDDLFAGRGSFVYPVYHRDTKVWEYFIPWMRPPNEIASTPAGSRQADTTPPEEAG